MSTQFNSQKSFKSILQDQLFQEEKHAHYTPKTEDTSPAHLAFLIGKIGGKRTQFDFQAPPKASAKAYPRTPPKPRPNHSLSPSQRDSYLFLLKWAGDIAENFSLNELKQAFRRAALKLHPDQGGSAQDFMSLRHHIQNLEVLVLK